MQIFFGWGLVDKKIQFSMLIFLNQLFSLQPDANRFVCVADLWLWVRRGLSEGGCGTWRVGKGIDDLNSKTVDVQSTCDKKVELDIYIYTFIVCIHVFFGFQELTVVLNVSFFVFFHVDPNSWQKLEHHFFPARSACYNAFMDVLHLQGANHGSISFLLEM